MRKLLMFLGLLVLIIFLLLLLQPKWYLKNAAWKVDSAATARLTELGDSALGSADVPVAALILYRDTVIGAGYNTVLKDRQAGGHAEINAISDAMRRIGVDSFMKLNRERLVLITTFEPCLMCKGAIIEYKIRHVVVIKPKTLSHWAGQWIKEAQYEWNKQRASPDTLQESLFRKHPLYKPTD